MPAARRFKTAYAHRMDEVRDAYGARAEEYAALLRPPSPSQVLPVPPSSAAWSRPDDPRRMG
ncbi:hypothetical protein C5C33_12135, partial [Rathayibacter sp. AY1H3]